MSKQFEEIFNKIEKTAENNIIAKEGDYIVDGILYCGECNTPKQCRVELFGKMRTPPCLCKCAAEKRAAEEAEIKRQQMRVHIENMRRKCFPEAEEMKNWTFANDDLTNERISKIARRYVENFDKMCKDGKGLLLYGDVGTGKTYASAAIANALIDKGVPCLVTNFARLVNTISGMYDGKQDYIDGLNRYGLLVIDDLASERNTEYMNENVQNIIDSRYRAGLPVIITTNLTAAELKNPAEIEKQRIYSRLFEMCIPVEVKGVDRRREKLKHDFAEYDDLLGLKG